jgi:hypothetical protein
VETSDVDVDIVYWLPLDDTHRAKAQSLDVPGTSLAIDPTIWSLGALTAGVPPYLKRRVRLVYGEDVCRSLPITPIATWAHERMHAACWLLAHVYDRPLPLALTVEYPDEADEYFGYVNRMVSLPSGDRGPTTRNLVRTTGWVATARLAHQASVYADRKRDVPTLYRHHIGGEWANHLVELHEQCVYKWRYLIPDAPTARQRLRALCQRTLAFERAFLLMYRELVLGVLRGPDREAREQARARLRETPLADPHVQELVGSALPGGH